MSKRPKVVPDELPSGDAEIQLPPAQQAPTELVWEFDLPVDCWQRILFFLPQHNDPINTSIAVVSRLSFSSRAWRKQLWLILQRFEFKASIYDSRSKYLVKPDKFLPVDVTFPSLVEFVMEVEMEAVSVVLQNSPRLREATLTGNPDCWKGISTHPTLKKLKVVGFAGKWISPYLPAQLTHLTIKPTPEFLQGIAQAVPNLVSLVCIGNRHFTMTDKEALNLKGLTALQELQLPELYHLEQLIDDPDTQDFKPCMDWIREHLPPVPLKNLRLGSFGPHFFATRKRFLKGLELGFTPTAQTLCQLSRNHNSKQVGLLVLQHFDIASLSFPLKQDEQVFSLLNHTRVAEVIFNKFYVPYIKKWTPSVLANSPGVTEAQVEAHIGCMSLEVDDDSASMLAFVIGNHQFPLDVNWKFPSGRPLIHHLSSAGLRLLIERAKAFNTQIDWRATDSTGKSVIHHVNRLQPDDRWEFLEAVASADWTYFLEHPFEFLDDLGVRDDDGVRDRLFRLFLAHLASSSLSGMEIATRMLKDRYLSDDLLGQLAKLSLTDSERIECVRSLIFDRVIPIESAAEKLLLRPLASPPRLFREHDGSTVLHLIRCMSPAWIGIVGPDDIRTPNKSGETPLHRWLIRSDTATFWKFCVRHKARVDDFELRNAGGTTVLELCRPLVAGHQEALRRLLASNRTDEDRQFLSKMAELITVTDKPTTSD